MFGTAGYLSLQSILRHRLLDDFDDLLDVLLPILIPLGDPYPQRLVHVGLEMLQTQILQFILDPPDAEPVRKRSINFQRFLGNFLPLVLAQVLQRAHVVQPVGEFDEDDTNIVRHRQHHLSEILSLSFLIVTKRNLADLRDTPDEMDDLRAELPFKFFRSGQCIFQGIVEQSGDHGGDIGPEQRQDAGNGKRVLKVRFSRTTNLPFVSFSGKFVRLADRLRSASAL